MARARPPDDHDPRRGNLPGSPRLSALIRLAAVMALALGLPACASVGPGTAVAPPPPMPVSSARFDLARDRLAFANLVRAENPGRTDLFANYCIVMARAVSQFFRFARFAPDHSQLPAEAYARLVREVLGIAPWGSPRSEAERVVIPGYAGLHDFSRAHEATIKAAFGSHMPSMMHWRTWRVGFPLGPAHQARVARELAREVAAGRPSPVMITNFPDPDLLNHAVLVYAYRVHSGVVEFLAYDPNDPGNPLAIHFDPSTRGFWVEPLTYSPPGRIRAFRLYASPLL